MLLLTGAGQRPAVSVRDITLTFVTQQDAKPRKAQVRGTLVCSGQTLATLSCCSGNQKRDRWIAGSTHFRNMQMVQPLPRVALTGCKLDLGMNAPTGSRWTVSPTLTVDLSNSRKVKRSFDYATLISNGPYVSKSFGLDLAP